MNPTEIRLWVIIPVYGNWQDTLECLTALASQTSSAFRVVIADDGSPEAPPLAIGGFPFADYHRWENRGFAENCTVAASVAITRGATHLLFLNSDTTFPASFVERWIATIAQLPDAILSPLIYWFDRRKDVWYSGGKMSIWIPFVRQRQEYLETTAVDIVTGCAILVPVNRWLELGGFDRQYVTYYEDFDFILRAKRKGIPIYVVPDAGMCVWHKASGSFRGVPRWNQQYRMLTSSLIFIRMHYRGLDKVLCLALKFAHLAAIGSRCFPELPQARALWKAVADGFQHPVHPV